MLQMRLTLPRLLLVLGVLLGVLPNAVSAQQVPAPHVSTPTISLRGASPVVGDALWLTVEWAVESAGVRRYELQPRVDGGTWTTVKLRPATATRRSVQLAVGSRVQFRVRGVAASGAVGPWAEGEVNALTSQPEPRHVSGVQPH